MPSKSGHTNQPVRRRRDLERAVVAELVTLGERLASASTITQQQAATIDRYIRNSVPCRMRPCRRILSDLEAVSLCQIERLAQIVIACRSPLEAASGRILSRAAPVFAAERVDGVHVASVACEARDVADAIRALTVRRRR